MKNEFLAYLLKPYVAYKQPERKIPKVRERFDPEKVLEVVRKLSETAVNPLNIYGR